MNIKLVSYCDINNYIQYFSKKINDNCVFNNLVLLKTRVITQEKSQKLFLFSPGSIENLV